MHTLQLQATDSREASEEELTAADITPEQMPPGWRIRAHQAATIRALRSGDAPIIVNQAMTGDGKTLAGRFRLFNDGLPTFAMYPTNELIADQARGLNEQLNDWGLPFWKGKKPAHEILNAPRLDELQEDLARADTLRWILDNDLILTNPDMFHLMTQFAYRRQGAARDMILGELIQRYQLFVFDEFHLFGAAQTASVLIAVLLMRAISSARRPPRFLFLSATPQDMLGGLAKLVDLRVEHVHGDYQHGSVAKMPGWRRILQPATLTLYPERLEAWLESHFEDTVRRFFAENSPGAKGVVIANSVAVAHRAFESLHPLCEKAGIRLGINTGLTPVAQRGGEFDLLVATSTIDVGVDFKINLLIFESTDAASHMQRLGRLGRHVEDGKGNPFGCFEAHALLPEWVIEGIKAKFQDGASVSREEYGKALREIYPPLQQFQGYIKRWAGVQAAHVLGELGKPEIKTQYELVRRQLKEQFKTLFPGGVKKYLSLIEAEQNATLDAAKSFRDSSPFTAVVVDPTGTSQTVVAYNLIALLRNAELQAIDLDEMYRHARQQGQSTKAMKRSQPLAAYRLVGWLPKPRPVNIYLDRAVNGTLNETVTEMNGFRFDVSDVPELNRLNRRLEQRQIAVLLLAGQDPDMLRRRLRLGYQLELFKFRSMDGIEGCVAFARDALLLDSVLYRQRSSRQDNPLIY
jgi:CRISPR-associated endonuclease/helicase Cas3